MKQSENQQQDKSSSLTLVAIAMLLGGILYALTACSQPTCPTYSRGAYYPHPDSYNTRR
jgi:thiol:disulfide interchange protein